MIGSLSHIFVASLAVLAGLCIYASIHHLWVGWGRPARRVHLLFGILSGVAAAYVLAKLAAYGAENAAELVERRRAVVDFAVLFLGLFAWFVAEYTGEKRRWPLLGLGALSAFLLLANAMLPFGIFFSALPELRHITLPWGETVTDLRMRTTNLWFGAALGLFLSSFVYAGQACVRQYIHGDRQRARSLGLAIVVFFVIALINQVVNFGALKFVHTAEFGFIAMVLLMNWFLSQEMHRDAEKLAASEHRFRSLVDQSPFSIQVLAPDGRTLQVNRAWETLWGISGSALAGYNILQDRQLADKGILSYIKRGFAGESLELPPVIYNPQDTPELPGAPFRDRWVRAYIYPIKDEGGRVGEVILMHEDITERKRTDDAIRNIAEGASVRTGEAFFEALVKQLAALFEADYALVGVLDTHVPGTVNTKAVFAQGKTAENFSYSLDGTPCENVVGQQTCIYPSGVQHLFPDDALLAQLDCEGYIGTPLFDAQGAPIGIVVAMSRVPLGQTEYMRKILEILAARAGAELQRLQAEARIRQIAFRDPLTGLANRASLHETLPALLERARVSGRQCAMLLIDLDHFKTINDALSHHTGDLVLRAVARRLTEVAAKETFAARVGGDEFVLLMPEISGDAASAELQARRLAEAVVVALEKPIVIGDQQFKIDASIGATLFPQGSADEHDVLRHADIALYRAKSQGRGSIQFFSVDMLAKASERLEVERRIRHALANGGLALHLQPQLDKAGRIMGAEALLRCRRPDGSLLLPDALVPVAEESGLIHAIGQWALANACACLKSWESAAHLRDLNLSINVSNWQFVRDDFVAQVGRHLEQSGARASRLTIEITESVLLYDIDDAISKMRALKSMGLRLALDDFGTGFSSLSYLKRLPLDELKIDRSFIQTLDVHTPDVFIESIIAIGHAMGMSIVAEGVESEAQHSVLAKMGCDGFQGYLWSRPLPEDGFAEYMSASAMS